ncbi:MAG: hypothetical protein BGP24_20020 [Lysobacterales bacterium 69-70]|nr:MAG: hypothetical protein ABT27_17265 [Xanthomonadaceae bacterium SCN 69-25]OJY97260.1 MAG: hypothetical protein BGP24_20020 [Xanthomonadales bacterium 69-70]
MRNDLDAVVATANAMADQHGFVHCRVQSYEERILVFECADYLSAERYCGQRQLLDSKAWIDDRTPTLVFVRQP